MPESFDFATTDPGSGGENLAGDRLTQGADTLFVPAAYLVHGAAGGPYTRVEAGAGLPVAATQSGTWSATVTNAGTFAVQASQSGAWSVTAHAGSGPWPVTDNGGSLTVDDGGSSLTVDAVSLPLPTGAATEATLSTLNGKVTACDTGAVVITSGSVTVSATNLDVRDLTSVSDSVAAVQSGTWTVGVSGTVPVSAVALPLPTGAATEATLSALSGKVTACDTGAVVISSGAVTVSATNLDVRGLAYASDSVTAHQGGTWTARTQDGAGNALTSAARGSERALSVQIVDGSGSQVTSFGGGAAEHAGDSAHTGGDTGVLVLGVRNDSLATLAGTNLDFTPLAMTDAGEVYVVASQGNPPWQVSGLVRANTMAGDTATRTRVTGLSGSQQIVASGSPYSRVLVVIYNAGPNTVLIGLGSAAVTSTSFSYHLYPGETLEVDRFAGEINALLALSDDLRITEVTV